MVYIYSARQNTSQILTKKIETTLVDKYNEKGYRDAKIESDSVTDLSEKLVEIDITISEGNQYYFRDVRWVGNTIHSTAVLE
jgi:outer membrane protein insertion porin family